VWKRFEIMNSDKYVELGLNRRQQRDQNRKGKISYGIAKIMPKTMKANIIPS
jgi:hypothetical protein